jgi:hypothetical protein
MTRNLKPIALLALVLPARYGAWNSFGSVEVTEFQRSAR